MGLQIYRKVIKTSGYRALCIGTSFSHNILLVATTPLDISYAESNDFLNSFDLRITLRMSQITTLYKQLADLHPPCSDVTEHL